MVIVVVVVAVVVVVVVVVFVVVVVAVVVAVVFAVVAARIKWNKCLLDNKSIAVGYKAFIMNKMNSCCL